MKISIALFGPFRQFQSEPRLELNCPDATTLADVRAAFNAHAQTHWPKYQPGLLRSSAFATASAVLGDNEPLPGDGQLAILPPVNGG